MCKFRSAVAIKDGDTVKLMMLPGEDSHEKIRTHYNIRDGEGASASRQTPVEYYPTRTLKSWDGWILEFDADRPDWWTDAMTESATHQFQSDITPIIASGFDGWTGYLDLRSVTSIDGVTFGAIGGYIDLHNVTSIDGVTFGAIGGYLNLHNVTSIDAKQHRKVKGRIYLKNKTIEAPCS